MPVISSVRWFKRPVMFGLAALGIVLALIVLLSFELRHSYDREVDYATEVTGALAKTLEQQLLASMGQIDLLEQEAAVQYAAHRSGTGLPAKDMNAMLARHLARVPGLLSLRLINEKGDYVFDASGTPSSANVGDRRYFRVHQESPSVGLFPEGPLFSRVVSQWTLTFSRGVRGPDNRFLGIVQSSIQTDALAGAFDDLGLSGTDSVTLLSGEGLLVARFPNLPDVIGKPSISEKLKGFIDGKVRDAVYSAPSGADGRNRLYTLRRIGGHPFYVLVGISYDTILDGWRRTATVYGGLSAILLLGAALLTVRTIKRYGSTVRQAEEQRRLTAEVFASSLEGFIVCDLDGRIISANRAVGDITGYAVDDVIGQTPAIFKSGVHDKEFYRAFWDSLNSKGRWQGEIWNRRKSGDIFPEWLSVSVVNDEQGQPLRYVAVYTDISETKAVQQQLEFFNSELLRLAEVMAHHLQEPVRIVIVYCQLLKHALEGQALSAEVSGPLAMIEQQTKKLRALIRDIQRYLAVAEPVGKVAPLCLSDAVDLAIARREKTLREIGATVTVQPDLPSVSVDRGRLVDMFDAVFDNSIRYRRPDQPLVISLRAETKGRRVTLRVADNGIGIEPQYRDRVFRVFERVDQTPDSEGTGIGLAIVRRVVEHCGGRVWIEDTPDGGTTLGLDLPAA
ncbi:MAG TPA: PAS domain S-box protein [Rhodospirillaceae bacterium]|nr:PAS domain S-box protein [Rhodospirillaceae bacterium]